MRQVVRRDWSRIIEKLNRSPRGEMRIRMGSPGSAQVTRCRLLEQWSNLRVRTERSMLHLQLVKSARSSSQNPRGGKKRRSATSRRPRRTGSGRRRGGA